MKKNTLFLLSVLVLFWSCAQKIEKCRILPKISVEIEKMSESIRSGEKWAQISCNFYR